MYMCVYIKTHKCKYLYTYKFIHKNTKRRRKKQNQSWLIAQQKKTFLACMIS